MKVLTAWMVMFAVAPAVFSETLRLSWVDHSDNEDGFWIERSIDGVFFEEIGETPANRAFFEDATVESGNCYYYRVQAFNMYGLSDYTDTARVEVTDEQTELQVLKRPESSVIGSMSVQGESEFDVGARAFSISASGDGYEQILDELRFTQVEADGDFKLRVRVHAFEADGSWARVGLMARESLEQGSRHESVVLNGNGYVERLTRAKSGSKVSTAEQELVGAAVFLGIERRAGLIYLSYSRDGEVWKSVSGSVGSMSGPVHVGIAIGSERDGRLSMALVEVEETDLMAFDQCSPKWPYLLGQAVEEQIIGELNDIGSYAYDDATGVHFLEASGAGYEQLDDELRFSKVTVSGDVDFSVKLSVFKPDASWARAGIMLRSSLDQRAAHFSIVVNGNRNFESLIRAADGAKVLTLRGKVAPSVSYLRIRKEGRVAQGFYSVDGASWVLMDDFEFDFGDTFEAGLVIGSEYDGRLSSARFEVLSESVSTAGSDPDLAEPSALMILGQAAESSLIGTMSDEGETVFDELAGLYFMSASGLGHETYRDELRYTWVPMVGDFSLKVQLHDFVADDDWGRVGLMIRESLEPDSVHASVTLNGRGRFETLIRSGRGAKVATSEGGSAGANPQLRLDRIGQRVKLYGTANGVDWRMLKDIELSLSSNAMIGLAIGSQADGELSSCVIELLD